MKKDSVKEKSRKIKESFCLKKMANVKKLTRDELKIIKEEIKEHVLLMVRKSNLQVKVDFVEEFFLISTGTFYSDDFKIRFCLSSLLTEFENLKKIGIHFPSLLHMADVIASHELGHAYDELTRNYSHLQKKYNEQLWFQADHFIKDSLKYSFRQYAKYNFEIEQIAWKHSKQFMLLTVDETIRKSYEDYCLSTYSKSYSFKFKRYLIGADLMQRWRNSVILGENQSFNYDLFDHGFTSYDKETKALNINLSQLIYNKPKDLDISLKDYLFYQPFYKLAYGKHVSGYVESEIGNVIFKTSKTLSYETSVNEIESLNEYRRNEIQQCFSYMENRMASLPDSYLIFKSYSLNEIERDLNDNLDFLKEIIEKRAVKEKQSVHVDKTLEQYA